MPGIRQGYDFPRKQAYRVSGRKGRGLKRIVKFETSCNSLQLEMVHVQKLYKSAGR